MEEELTKSVREVCREESVDLDEEL